MLVMGLGIVGPIGLDRLADFAISTVFHVREEKSRSSASCKLCGARLLKGAGQKVVIVTGSGATGAYACGDCVDRIKAARNRFRSQTTGDDSAR